MRGHLTKSWSKNAFEAVLSKVSFLPKVCQVDYVHLEADQLVFETLNIAKVGFQMNIINLTHFIPKPQWV